MEISTWLYLRPDDDFVLLVGGIGSDEEWVGTGLSQQIKPDLVDFIQPLLNDFNLLRVEQVARRRRSPSLMNILWLEGWRWCVALKRKLGVRWNAQLEEWLPIAVTYLPIVESSASDDGGGWIHNDAFCFPAERDVLHSEISQAMQHHYPVFFFLPILNGNNNNKGVQVFVLRVCRSGFSATSGNHFRQLLKTWKTI